MFAIGFLLVASLAAALLQLFKFSSFTQSVPLRHILTVAHK